MLQVVPWNMYIAIKKSNKVAQKVDSCNMSRKQDTVLRAKSMLQVDTCNMALRFHLLVINQNLC